VKPGLPVGRTRACISHSNFMSREAVEQAARLGVMMDHPPLALPRRPTRCVKTVRLRAAALLPAAAQPVAAGAIAGGVRPHAEDRFTAVGQIPTSFLGMATAVTRTSQAI